MQTALPPLVHMCVDGYASDILSLRDESLLREYFSTVNTAAFRHILYYPDDQHIDMEGVTGCLLAPGMHATVHTYTNDKKKCFFLDFFNFEEKFRPALSTLDTAYKTKYSLQHTLVRSQLEYAHGVEHANNPRIYGPHLMAEGQLSGAASLQDIKDTIIHYLEEIPAQIDMHPLTEVFHTESDTWISALRVIAESHISLHYHIPSQSLFVDIFSCKPFDKEKAVILLKKSFSFTSYTQCILERGLHFPR